jgi:hypothetical protein
VQRYQQLHDEGVLVPEGFQVQGQGLGTQPEHVQIHQQLSDEGVLVADLHQVQGQGHGALLCLSVRTMDWSHG